MNFLESSTGKHIALVSGLGLLGAVVVLLIGLSLRLDPFQGIEGPILDVTVASIIAGFISAGIQLHFMIRAAVLRSEPVKHKRRQPER